MSVWTTLGAVLVLAAAAVMSSHLELEEEQKLLFVLQNSQNDKK